MTEELTVTSNYHWRELVEWHQLPEDAQADFDYLNENDKWSPRFVLFRGDWIDTGDAERSNISGWDGQQTDSFSSATVWRFNSPERNETVQLEDWAYVQIGRVYS